MQKKKVVDWIKYKNIQESTRNNNSALKGLRRVNKILSRSIKLGIFSFISLSTFYYYYRDYNDTMNNAIPFLEKRVATIPDKKNIYMQNHIKLSLEYSDLTNILNAEDKAGLTYYREKLIKNASGLVLETCK